MTAPRLAAVDLAGDPTAPTLVVGPSLGTSVTALWGAVARRLAGSFHVVGWDLPGHGRTHEVPDGLTVEGLAAGVLDAVDRAAGEGTVFAYAGDSVGGAVGLQLLLDAPARVSSATLLCTGAQIGDPAWWRERAGGVRSDGTSSLVEAMAARWFGPGFARRRPAVVETLLDALQDASDEGYAQVCEALAAFDVRGRLGEIDRPVLGVGGSADEATPVAGLRLVTDGVRDGRLVVLDGVAHQAPAEAPDEVARLVREHALVGVARTEDDVRAEGLAVRREVLGDAHVDRAESATTAFTRDFQDLITRYAWGGIWTRPGLDRRSRSMITLTALVALGHHDELAMHVRAARTNGLSEAEIGEVLLQSAVYCGVPAANTAFRIAQQVLSEEDQP